MSDIVIKVENLSKQYRLGVVGTGTLTHDLNRWWHGVRGKEDPYLKIGETNDRATKGESDYVWALKDINFEVKQGEVLGIIGKNGAGKSTLLKLLSRVTTPTTGEIKSKGRIASLLEVGTGFHPELTGRENVFLNGAILGMTKTEIKAKYDEIVDFSGTARYVDTPVKRYSSGMRVRLAFAVAAHLEPEILIIDEVLAVGDAEFQEKCLGKIKDVSIGEGRTVLFVSHNMTAVQTLCKESIILQNGQIIEKGDTRSVVKNYLFLEGSKSKFSSEIDITKSAQIIFGIIHSICPYGQFIDVKLEIHSKTNLKCSLDLRLYDSLQQAVGFGSLGTLDFNEMLNISKGKNTVEVRINTNKLAIGHYTISFDLTIPNKEYLDRKELCLDFELINNNSEKSGRSLDQKWGFGSSIINLKQIKTQ